MTSLQKPRTLVFETPANWPVRRLGTFASKVGSGATPRGGKSVYLASRITHALIRSQHVFDRWFDGHEIAYISEEHAHELRNAEVRPGDVLLNITGDGVTFGRACIVPDNIIPACVNQHVSIVRVNHDICIPGYLLAFLTHPLTKRYIESFSTGGSRRAITKGHIESFEIPLPPVPLQRRIADILLAYDELIDNNQRRIEMLETMARALYREWFVHFRFPGHDRGSRVGSPLGSIPKGWSVVNLETLGADESYAINGGPFGSKLGTKDYRDDGVPVIRGSNLSEAGRFLSTGFVFVSKQKAEELRANLARPGDIVVTQRGTLGQIGMIPSGTEYKSFVISQSQMKISIDQKKANREFIFFFLRAEESIQRIKNLASSSGVPHINLAVLREFQTLLPPRQLQELFGQFAAGTESTIETLTRQIQNLRRTRDLLLPRLLSGQIDVGET